MTAHKIHGNSFSQIAKMVPGRTDVRSIVCARPGCVCACGMCALLSPACMEHFFAHDVKNRWYGSLARRWSVQASCVCSCCSHCVEIRSTISGMC